MRSLLIKPELYKATTEGKKTETRRLHGLKEINEHPEDWILENTELIAGRFYAIFYTARRFTKTVRMICAKYRIGETLYLAESHYLPARDHLPVLYKDTVLPGLSLYPIYRSVSPMFLKEIHAREFVQIKSIRIERVQSITEEGAISEGLPDRESYIKKWDEINKKMPSHQNPWVFAYHYEYQKEKSKRVK